MKHPKARIKDYLFGLFHRDTKSAALAGTMVTLLSVATFIIININSDGEAYSILQGILPAVRFLSSGIMTAATTTLALMLTLVGFSLSMEKTLETVHFERVREIALINCIILIVATTLLLFTTVPLSETSEVPSGWYEIFYYFVLFFSGLLSGSLVFVVVRIYNALTELIDVVNPEGESELVRGRQNGQENNQQERQTSKEGAR